LILVLYQDTVYDGVEYYSSIKIITAIKQLATERTNARKTLEILLG
jgi:hypothetical protein